MAAEGHRRDIRACAYIKNQETNFQLDGSHRSLTVHGHAQDFMPVILKCCQGLDERRIYLVDGLQSHYWEVDMLFL